MSAQASARKLERIRGAGPAAVVFLLSLLAAIGLAIAMTTDRALELLVGAVKPAVSAPPSAGGASLVGLIRPAPAILPGTPPPHGPRGACPSCHTLLAATPSPAPSAPLLAAAPFAQGSALPVASLPSAPLGERAPVAAAPTAVVELQAVGWQGLRAVALTPALGQALALPSTARGVVVDQARGPAAAAALQLGDLVTAVGGAPTPDLAAFLAATATEAARPRARLVVSRGGSELGLDLAAPQGSLGAGVAARAPAIDPTRPPPHGKIGECARCHTLR